MGSKAVTYAANNQLEPNSSAMTSFGAGGDVSMNSYSTVTDFGAIQAGANVSQGAINRNAEISESAMLYTTTNSEFALEQMTRAAESSNLAAALSSQAAANAAMYSSKSSADLANSFMGQSYDLVNGVLGAVKSNSLAMVSSSEQTNSATADMTKKLLIGAGILGAVFILR